ncbi:dTDP-4-dehydrorhamnose 3,5-epimerase [Desulfogranum mediterraneum]|uniref:dTDP-4-dehydrorhamnose 3,5-epimerase n=1 Tax=Desulfogranum mediterraneum TaxID=160661 RepID=UPI00040F11EC|nr:dTDP-4-dehydrorhamnose 3,5-epimerase [Desulfogranum mediterraneum]
MQVTATEIPEVLVIEPQVFGDSRGFFFESFNQRSWQEMTGLDTVFVQENHSRSHQNVLRGLHYQIRQAQGKLVRVIQGEVYDVAVDLRQSSATFGRWAGIRLTAENKKQFWVPPGFGHGFVVLSEVAEFLYLTTDYYAPEHERAIIWNDPQLAIDWPLKGEPQLSAKDEEAVLFKDAELYA